MGVVAPHFSFTEKLTLITLFFFADCTKHFIFAANNHSFGMKTDFLYY